MSILIKGIKIPKDGEAIVLVISNENGKMLAEVDEYCGAVYECVPVPPHGDLIERKAVCLTDFEIVMCNGDYKEGMKMLLEKIESAPTIIPASEEGE